MTTLYQVTEHDKQIRFYWYATKKAALKHIREYERPEGWTHGECELNTIEFPVTKAGIVEAMNHVITLTCFNEG